MKIRKRLVISNLAMIFIPLALIMLAAGVFHAFSLILPDAASRWSLVEKSAALRDHSTGELSSAALLQISRLIAADPFFHTDTAKTRSFVDTLDWPGGLAILRGQEALYISPGLHPADPESDFRTGRRNPQNHNILVATIALPQIDTQTEEALLYLYTDRGLAMRQALVPALLFMLAATGILVLTNGSLTWLVSRSIIRPLAELEKKALRIRDGDLSPGASHQPSHSRLLFRKPASQDEFDSVFAAFDEMRLRLKASLESQLKDEQSRQELLAAISHDLRTPLSIIKGYAEGLQDGVAADPAKIRTYLQTILLKTRQMDQLIEDLFLFSRLDLDGFPWDLQPVDASAFIASCVEELAADYPALRFDVLDETSGMFVQLDTQRMRRVFVNIVQNAVAYAHPPQGGDTSITIKVGAVNGSLVISCCDNGPGLPAGIDERIFERFFRADKSRSGGGAGLGMAIARLIVEGQGGSIRAANAATGSACFTITLPAAAR